jgi:putative peptidoglycan lipid II flippase
MAANVVLSFALFFAIGPVGIALATTLAGWLNVTLLAIMLKRRGEFTLNATFRRALFGIVAASAVMGAGVWVLASWLEPYLAPGAGLLVQGAALALLVGAGLLIYAASVELSGAVRLRSLPQILLGR